MHGMFFFGGVLLFMSGVMLGTSLMSYQARIGLRSIGLDKRVLPNLPTIFSTASSRLVLVGGVVELAIAVALFQLAT